MRPIDADAFIERFSHTPMVQEALKIAMDKMPTIEPKRDKGEWIRNDNGTYSCSLCQSWVPKEQYCYARYCLYCGADMREKQND